VGQQPRRDAPRAVLAGDRPPRARREGHLIDIGTRRTRTTAHADHYLEFKPHTDLAIANGIAHLLVAKNGTYDKDFVEKHCNFRADKRAPTSGRPMTFEEYKARLAPYTPEHVEELSGVPAEKHPPARRPLRPTRPAITSLWCMGMNQHTRGTAINSLVHGDPPAQRALRAPGRRADEPHRAAVRLRHRARGRHARPRLPGGRVVAKRRAPQGTPRSSGTCRPAASTPSPATTPSRCGKRFCTPKTKGGDIDTIWVQVTNPGQTLPNLHALFPRAARTSPTSSSSCPTSTRRPPPRSPTSSCRRDVGREERHVRQLRAPHPAVVQDGRARPARPATTAGRPSPWPAELFERGHPGMKDKDGASLPDADAGREVPVWDWRTTTTSTSTSAVRGVPAVHRIKHKDLAPYDEYVKARGLRWPVVQQPDGTWRETRFRFASSTTRTSKKGGHPVLPLGHQGRPGAHLVPPLRAAAESPTRSTRSGCAPAACSSTGTPAR
jgi:nitrate reductase NapA